MAERKFTEMSDKVLARKIRQREKWLEKLAKGDAIPRGQSRTSILADLETMKNEVFERLVMAKPGPKF